MLAAPCLSSAPAPNKRALAPAACPNAPSLVPAPMLLLDPATALAVLLLALVLDALVGDPPWLWARWPHPVVLLGRCVKALEGRLYRPGLAPASLRRRGTLLAGLVVGAAFGVGLFLQALLALVPFGWIGEAVLVAVLLAQGSLVAHVRAVASGLERGLAEGRSRVAMIVGRDPQSLDRPAVARAAVESLAENLSDGVVAPAFWALVLGLPGILAYKAANTLDSMVGYKNERYLDFGRASARLDDALNWLPARLTALLAVVAAIGPGTSARAALRTLRRDADKHRSPNAGWPEAAFAGALGFKLSGPRGYGGVVRDEPWVGEGADDPGVAGIRRAVGMAWRVWAVMGAVLSLCLLRGMWQA